MSLFDAVIGGVGSIVGAGLGYMGSQQAADAAKKAGKLQYNQYLQTRADYEPWRQAGLASLADLSAAINNGDFSKFYSSPGYQYRQDEGRKAIERSASARGSLDSGASLKAISDYGQQTASDEYTNYLNRLMSMAGLGQTAQQDTARYGFLGAQGYGQGIADAGAIRGTSYANLGNSLTGGLNNALTALYYQRPTLGRPAYQSPQFALPGIY